MFAQIRKQREAEEAARLSVAMMSLDTDGDGVVSATEWKEGFDQVEWSMCIKNLLLNKQF